MTAEPPVVFLLGPTGSGKTELSLAVCERFPCEIVNVDSALVYRGMNVGTAKPSSAVRRRISHHLMDILDPSERYSAARFREDALRLLPEIRARGKIPLLVGGTMFYFHALEHGLDTMPEVSDTIRKNIDELGGSRGRDYLYEELQRLDPAAAERIHPHDTQRIKRAVGVCRSGQGPFSSFQHGGSKPLPFRLQKLALDFRDRSLLRKHISDRFTRMLENGLIGETAGLMVRPDFDADSPAMRAVGYAQVRSYLSGRWSFDEMQSRAVSATRQLAKRQLTWMRKMKNLQRFHVDDTRTDTTSGLFRVIESVSADAACTAS